MSRFLDNIYHSVTLDEDKCKGCTTCLKRCPTEAIRIRNGKARIIKELCIDCGECIKVCPYHAKKAVTDSLERLGDYKYNVALPAPALYGQFQNLKDIDIILNGLLEIGFDDVYETAKATEAITDYTKELLATKKIKKPVINSACPAVVRLICVRFPSLIEHLIPVIAPFEAAAIAARAEAVKKTGLSPSEIGVFFISPCSAKATTIPNPIGIHKSPVSGVISIQTVYLPLAPAMRKLKEIKPISNSSIEGINWARSGGEVKALGHIGRCLCVDGVENIIRLFEQIEDDEALDIDFIEALACECGCVSGPLTVENGYVAKMRVVELGKAQKLKNLEKEKVLIDRENLSWEKPVVYRDVNNLDSDLKTALNKLHQIEEIYKTLPQTDCGSCGSPTCKCFAEDIVRGKAEDIDCIYKLKEKVNTLMSE